MNKPYQKYFLREAFLKADVEKAIRLTTRVISKRIGKKIYMSELPDEIVKAGSGKMAGIICTISDGRMIRFNWKMSDTSGQIVSVDFWNKIKLQPDLTLDIPDVSIVKIIDAIVSTLTSKQPGTYQFEEHVLREENPKSIAPDKDIAKSIKQYAIDMNVDDEKLAKNRLSFLYKDYEYWNKEVTEEPFKLASYASFRNFLIDFMSKNDIQNIFMRKVQVSKASKEMKYADEVEKKEFDKTIFEITLEDKINFLKKSIMMVVKGYQNSIILGGTAGIGKSQSLKDILYAEKSNFKIGWEDAKDFTKFSELYKYLYDNNSKDTILVFDDIPSVLSKKFLPIMNAAMAPAPKRILSYATGLEKQMPKGYEPSFLFESKIIIITNIPRNKVPASLVSRGSYVELQVSPQEALDYIRQNIDKVMTEYKMLTKEIKLEIVDFLERIGKEITAIDFRTFKTIALFRLTGDPAWKKDAYMIVKGMA